MSLNPLLPISPTRPLTQTARAPRFIALAELIHSNFSLTTWLLTGAILQSTLTILLPSNPYALLPALLLLTARILNALLIHCSILPNPYLKDVLPGKTTALLPSPQGDLSLAASRQQKIAVCLLGAKSNHPFGVLAPEFLKTFSWLARMNASFDTPSSPSGFLGQTNWQRKDPRGGMEFLFLSYWRSIEDLHAFAHAPLHREAWTWWEKTVKAHGFIGINHEIYEAEAGHWENVYVNFQPTGLGATSFLRRGEGEVEGGKVADEWIGPLVDARRGKVRSSAGRLGRGATKYDEGRPTGEVYLERGVQR